jgi:hypothetical protein
LKPPGRAVSPLNSRPLISPGRTPPPRLKQVKEQRAGLGEEGVPGGLGRTWGEAREEFDESHLSVLLQEMEYPGRLYGQTDQPRGQARPQKGQKVYRERKKRVQDSSDESQGSIGEAKYTPLKFVESEEAPPPQLALRTKQALVDQKNQVFNLKQKISSIMAKGLENLSSAEKRYLKQVRRNIEEGRFEDQPQ